MSEKSNRLFKGFKKKLGDVQQRIQGFRSRSPSPSSASREGTSGTANDPDVSRRTSVSSHRNPQAGEVERGSLPNRPPESNETSSSRPRSAPPSRTAVPSIVINGDDGQAVESGENSNLEKNPVPQSPNQGLVPHSSTTRL